MAVDVIGGGTQRELPVVRSPGPSLSTAFCLVHLRRMCPCQFMVRAIAADRESELSLHSEVCQWVFVFPWSRTYPNLTPPEIPSDEATWTPIPPRLYSQSHSTASFAVYRLIYLIISTGFTLLCAPAEYMCSRSGKSILKSASCRCLRQLIQRTTLPGGHLTETHSQHL
jgi:hypothetical protein